MGLWGISYLVNWSGNDKLQIRALTKLYMVGIVCTMLLLVWFFWIRTISMCHLYNVFGYFWWGGTVIQLQHNKCNSDLIVNLKYIYSLMENSFSTKKYLFTSLRTKTSCLFVHS